MKQQILLLAALCCAVSLFAQNQAVQKSGKYQPQYSEVIVLDSFSASQLFVNAKLFLSNTFQGAREGAQIRDDRSKMVATKGSFPVTIQNNNGEDIRAKVIFTLVIQSKEGMYKYTVDDLYFAFTEETGITSYASFNDRLGISMTKKQWEDVELQTNQFMSAFVENIKTNMTEMNEIGFESALAKKRK